MLFKLPKALIAYIKQHPGCTLTEFIACYFVTITPGKRTTIKKITNVCSEYFPNITEKQVGPRVSELTCLPSVQSIIAEDAQVGTTNKIISYNRLDVDGITVDVIMKEYANLKYYIQKEKKAGVSTEGFVSQSDLNEKDYCVTLIRECKKHIPEEESDRMKFLLIMVRLPIGLSIPVPLFDKELGTKNMDSRIVEIFNSKTNVIIYNGKFVKRLENDLWNEEKFKTIVTRAIKYSKETTKSNKAKMEVFIESTITEGFGY